MGNRELLIGAGCPFIVEEDYGLSHPHSSASIKQLEGTRLLLTSLHLPIAQEGRSTVEKSYYCLFFAPVQFFLPFLGGGGIKRYKSRPSEGLRNFF